GGVNEDVWYTDQFSGTSSASPIVVGAVGCLQGAMRSRGTPQTPAQVRASLRGTGSAQQDAPGRPVSQRIGSRPDLRQLLRPVKKVEFKELKERKLEKIELKERKAEAKELKREKLGFKERKEVKPAFEGRKKSVATKED